MGQINIHYIQKPSFEFAYASLDNQKIISSTSIKALEKILTTYQKEISPDITLLKKKCLGYKKDKKVFYLNLGENETYDAQKLIISDPSEEGKIEWFGCLL